MTVLAAPLPATVLHAESPAEARKRRREILAQQRTTSGMTPDASVSLESTISDTPVANEVPAKRRKVADDESKEKSSKKPQMKYDPEVPMSKEQAAVWRREQRRKRNRESAAASRQRQRDRISELEVEVTDWKSKCEAVLAKIAEIEKIAEMEKIPGFDKPRPTGLQQSQPFDDDRRHNPMSKYVSPPSSPGHLLLDSQELVASPVVSSSFSRSLIATDRLSVMDSTGHVSDSEEQPDPVKMISRQAVKIPGSGPALPLLPSRNAVLPPDTCLSSVSEIKLAPIDSNLFPASTERLPALLTDEESEDEFGEFLLDAVQWL